MAAAFTRTLRSLRSDSFARSAMALGVAAILLGAWLAWFFLATIERYEVSESARVEVDTSIHVIQAPIAGRVVVSRLAIGQEVTEGEVLVQLDADEQRLQLDEERTRLTSIPSQVDALRQQMTAQASARSAEAQGAAVATAQAQAQVGESAALERLAAEEAARLGRLNDQGLIPERDLSRGAAEAQSRKSATENLQLAASHIEQEQRKADQEREAQIQRLRGEIDKLDGDRQTIQSTIARLEYAVSQRRILAPVTGRLGEVAVLRVGGFVEEGDKLGAVIPRGDLRVIADFLPAAALGRVRPGQPARLRLDGFPWGQYGSIPASVTSVGSEVRDGRIRVELAIDASSPTAVPLQHGLPGTVEVHVESVSPATLALRAAGQRLSTPVQSSTAP